MRSKLFARVLVLASICGARAYQQILEVGQPATSAGDAPEGMKLHSLSSSGPDKERWNLAFFADGYTDEEQFISDAQRLTDDIVSESGALGHVKHLLNVYGVFVPSQIDGIGNHSVALEGAAFGLYRPGVELRAVMLRDKKRARAACEFWRDQTGEKQEGGCDQPIILGNDPSYGGLGGEFTIITASKLNGPLVLRHELGHSLIPVGEEYEGGFAYFGVNSQPLKNVNNLTWSSYLTGAARVEDMKVSLQVYPWHNLTAVGYSVSFVSSNPHGGLHKAYPSAMLRLSVSSIPDPSHLVVKLNSMPLSWRLPSGWTGSLDRAWVEIELPRGLAYGESTLTLNLTSEGRAHPEGSGGRLLGSLEVIEYGDAEKFNSTAGVISAFPTFSMDGRTTLRPTNEECLMRKVNHPTFCPVCADGLKASLERKIVHKKSNIASVQSSVQSLDARLSDMVPP